ncbi:hypothetical protein F2P81_006413 [Scophthalmus maximus]|uniref:Reverse transcriptase domain-containing protein n=1 Tax=Scophthalmus maximus TaxID=52904 RepID=A0A6A4T5W3_SCOMX|nr:hypothetical protein F2P81_006413 [Scophthalmus maximus]
MGGALSPLEDCKFLAEPGTKQAALLQTVDGRFWGILDTDSRGHSRRALGQTSSIPECFDMDIKKAIANKEVVVAVFLDIEKAYDMLWKEGLLIALYDSGIRGRMLNWIKNFLCSRSIQHGKCIALASPASALKVVHIGEAGVDSGALRKEFLTCIENRFFEGPGSQGKNPKFSLTDLDNENFRTIGEIIRVNLAQDGPAPAFFNEWCYNFICTGAVDLSRICKEDVADQESLLLINRVENVSDTEFLMLLAENIVNCGYTAQNKLDNKESIIRAIVLPSTTRLTPMLQQLSKGMELYGLVNQIAGASQ